MKHIAAHFINVDLDLKSIAPLSPLLQAWSGRVSDLSTPKKDGRKYWLRLGLSRMSDDPEGMILEFCRLVRRLRGAARAAWEKASSREFDIGIQAGLERVYSPCPLIEEERRRRGRMVPADVAEKRITRVSVDSKRVRVYLADGPVFYLPLSRVYRLSKATRAQRANWQLLGGGRRVYWPDLDEDLSVDTLLEGVP